MASRAGEADRDRSVLARGARSALWRLSPREWARLVSHVVLQSARDRITAVAAGLAFHGFLALLPILVAAVGLLSLIGLSPHALHRLVHDTSVLLPSQMANLVNAQLTRPGHRGAGLVELLAGSAVALWSSIEAISALEIALDVAYELPTDRNFLTRRLRALPLLGITVILGGSASILIVLGTPIRHLLPASFGLLAPEYEVVSGIVRYGGALLALMVLLSAYYRFGTSGTGENRYEWLSPGAVLAALCWVGAAAAFAFYLDRFGHEQASYGALAGAAVTLLWLYLTAIAVLLGAEFNRELERTEERRHGAPPPARW
ncbi:MAG: YihY/virulence factor BrkB family protein [Actinomycetota bacterium]|nr:YihY/virulence factor BrkB family protein [Actinomycetota bacterium]